MENWGIKYSSVKFSLDCFVHFVDIWTKILLVKAKSAKIPNTKVTMGTNRWWFVSSKRLFLWYLIFFVSIHYISKYSRSHPNELKCIFKDYRNKIFLQKLSNYSVLLIIGKSTMYMYVLEIKWKQKNVFDTDTSTIFLLRVH